MVDADPDASGDLSGETEELADALLDRILHYQAVLDAHGVQYPYGQPFSEADRIKLLPDDDD